MKVLHIVGGELAYGAARGALALHSALLSKGVESKVLNLLGKKARILAAPTGYGEYETCVIEPRLFDLALGRLQKISARFLLRLYPKRKKNEIFSTGFFGRDISTFDAYHWADVVHLHWVADNLMSVLPLKRVKKPLVWTLRDLWPLTGGCHYPMGCTRYETGCGSCRVLGSSQLWDLSRASAWVKKNSVPRTTTIVGISNWTSECARRSDVFRGLDIRMIPNGIDTKAFSPIEKAVARKRLGWPEGPIILGGATGIDVFYKGFDVLTAVAQKISVYSNARFVLFGAAGDEVKARMPKSTQFLGVIDDLAYLRTVYAAADVFAAPSRQEAFGKTLAEAMACGTPVVCFDATGPRDVVTHMVNGYKARAFDEDDFERGIRWVLDHPSPQNLSAAARAAAVSDFDVGKAAAKYEHLYYEMLERADRSRGSS